MKYRIWDKEDNRYRYDSFINQKGYVCKLGVYDYETPCVKRHNPQDRFTVELSTGLLDKNGVEIYSNDVIEFGNTNKVNVSNDIESLYNLHQTLKYYGGEITGNIHDTPREGE
jgi:hypothetical protein